MYHIYGVPYFLRNSVVEFTVVLLQLTVVLHLKYRIYSSIMIAV